MSTTKAKSVEAQMLIRKSAQEVFNAFIDPEKTKHFWFTEGSGKLEVNKEVFWIWEMYDLKTKVVATEITPNIKIKFDWYDLQGYATQVELSFKELKSGNTFVTAKHYGFKEAGDDLLAAIKDSTGGFNIVLCGLKCYLEHGFNLNLIGDKFPEEVREDCEQKE